MLAYYGVDARQSNEQIAAQQVQALLADYLSRAYVDEYFSAKEMCIRDRHNGGGTGIGRAINGGFGMVLDGSERVDTILRMSMPWIPWSAWPAAAGRAMRTP